MKFKSIFRKPFSKVHTEGNFLYLMKAISNNPEAYIINSKHFSLNLGTRKEHLLLPFTQWYFLNSKKEYYRSPCNSVDHSLKPSIAQKKLSTKEYIRSMVQRKYEVQKLQNYGV